MNDVPAARPARILFLCQDPICATTRGAQLTLAGMEVVPVADTVEALTATRKGVDLAVLHTPVDAVEQMDFPAVLRRVAGERFLPVVILADAPGEHHLCRFLDNGADEIVHDATSPGELVSRIRALLRIQTLHDELAESRTALKQALERERQFLDELRADNAELQVLCTTDPLTRLQNVRSFREILAHEFRVAGRYDQPLSLLMLDVDHFKLVNDAYGHPIGDYILKELAVVLTGSVRDADEVARTGGEEFSVVLPRANRRKAHALARRIRKEVAARDFAAYGQQVSVTVSVGLASYPEDAQISEPEMLLYFADQALLEAKDSGRDRVVAFSGLDANVRRRLWRQYTQLPAVQGGHETRRRGDQSPAWVEAVGPDGSSSSSR